MAARSNACSEVTRFWLEARHGCLVSESIPVPVPYGQSDLDLVAIHPALRRIALPDDRQVGPRFIVEAKDEHDWDASGRDFGKLLLADVDKMGTQRFVPRSVPGTVKFSMLRQAHFEKAAAIFGTDDFDRLFVVHAIAPPAGSDVLARLTEHRIFWLSVPEVVADLVGWYRVHPRPTSVRTWLVGDLLHLLVGFCRLELPTPRADA